MKLTSDISDIEPTPQEEAKNLAIHSDVQELALSREEILLAAKRNLDILAGLALPETCFLRFPAVYNTLWQMIVDSVDNERGFDRFAVGLPRGFIKTTVLKLFFLYCILYTSRNFLLYIGPVQRPHADSFISDIEDMLNEPNIIATYGDWKLNVDQNTQSLKKFTFRGRNIVVAGLGAGGSVRGLNIKNRRPDVIAMDDMQSWENAESITLADQLLSWMVGTLMKAASKFRCTYIFVGNLYPFPGSILRKLKHNPQWTSFIVGGLLADGESLWPELQSKEQLLAEYQSDLEMGKPEIFLAEILNDEQASGKSGIDVSSIQPVDQNLFNEWPQGKFIIIDPSNDKKNSDLCEILYCELYDEIPVAKKFVEGRFDPEAIIHKAIALALENGCKVIAVETIAFQYSLLYWFERISRAMEITGLHFVELHSGLSKNARIKEMLELLVKGKIKLSKELHGPVVYQIVHWNPLRKDNVDDLLDVLAYIYQVIDSYSGLIADVTYQEIATGSNVPRVRHLAENSAF